jgi:hypothetical protein
VEADIVVGIILYVYHFKTIGLGLSKSEKLGSMFDRAGWLKH